MAKNVNIKRTLHYFWQALMQHKVRTGLLLLFVPIWIFLSNVMVPYGTSQIIGKLSDGDFAIESYTGILLLTLLPASINNLAVIRVID